MTQLISHEKQKLARAYVALAVAREITERSLDRNVDLEMKALLNVLNVTRDLIDDLMSEAMDGDSDRQVCDPDETEFLM